MSDSIDIADETMNTLVNALVSNDKVSAPSVMLLGEPGNGKTFSAATLALHPYIEKIFYIFTDPGGDESLIDSFQYYDIPISKLHLRYIAPAAQGWDMLEELTKKVNTNDYESLAGIKSGIDKRGFRQMFELIETFGNFTCQRTGENFGSADEWPDTYAVVFDSLTGLNKIARETTVGAKPTLHQGEWGVAMSMEENFIRKFTAGIKCPRVMIGHLDKVMNEVQGRWTFQVSLLGNKLAPNIPHLFSDVVYAHRAQGKFLWSTDDDRISLKSRNLELSDKLIPSFKPVIEKWLKRREFMTGTKITS